MSLDKPGSVRFGDYTVELRSHALLRKGKRVSIQEQPFQILLALLECPGKVVTREELRRRLWGQETFVDFNQSMNSAVRRLRAALEDDPKAPLYIETVPRVGFRFCAEVALPDPCTVPLAADSVVPLVVENVHPAPPQPAALLPSRVVTSRPAVSAVFVGTLIILSGLLFFSPNRLGSSHVDQRLSVPAADPAVVEASSRTPASPMYIQAAGTSPPARDTTVTRPALESDSVDLEILEGRYLLSLRNDQSYARAEVAFHHALELDARSTAALVGLAQLHVLLSMNGREIGLHTAEAMSYAQQALAIDPNLASAHAALAAAHVVKDWNWSAASEEFQRAIALDPKDSLAHLWYAMFVLVPEKHYLLAAEQTKQAIALDPFSLISQTDLGWIYFNEGQRAAAYEQYNLVLRMNPDFVPARFRIAQSLAQDGRRREAEYFLPTEKAPARPAVVRSAKGTDPCRIAGEALTRHVTDPIPLLRAGVEHHCATLIYMDQDPKFAGLQKDPRFAALARSLNLPEH